MAQTLYDKLWSSHVVHTEGDGTTLLYIDRHLVHEVTSPQAYEGLRLAGRKPWRVSSIVATADHNVPTDGSSLEVADPTSRAQVETLNDNINAFGALAYFPYRDKRQGIVHVIGPENGATLPGMTVVCGDSHTSTHGAFACLAQGIGTSEVEHVLATQCLLQKKSKSMLIRVEGEIGRGVSAKDIVLYVIGQIGTAGGTGFAMEFGGSAIRALSMEGRMTVCNMAIEAGARAGMVAVDQTTIDYLRGRPFSPRDEQWDRAVEYWRTLRSDDGAQHDRVVEIDARPHHAAGHLGYIARNGHRCARSGTGAGRLRRSGAARGRCARAAVHGAVAAYSDRSDPHRQGVHRFLHQFAHRRSARGGQGRAGAAHRRQREAGHGGAGLRSGQGPGRGRRAGQACSRRPASSGASRAVRCVWA
jgi:homoaconitase/3-isopropylmalate dehydratase large subunit